MWSYLMAASALSNLAFAAAVPMDFPLRLYAAKSNKIPNVASCDLASATMPTASSDLPPVSPGLHLSHVAIGRGTQNYTCSSPSATPAPVGAVAYLYNVSCIAAYNAAVLATLPATALTLDSVPAGILQSGSHYFVDGTTAAFDMSPVGVGFTLAKKVAAVPSLTAGAVPWLKLGYQTTGSVGTVHEIYRMQTVGGSAPATCAGMGSTFQVPYASEYWFWSGQ
ncbi:MAG: hypothetical protein Q9187_007779 [Circinaria calcarea]